MVFADPTRQKLLPESIVTQCDLGSPPAIEKGGNRFYLFSLLRQSGAASRADDHLGAPAVMRPCRAERNGFGP